jgi:hypothetical protein
MSTATLQGLVWAASERLGEEYGSILRRIRRSAVVHADETSFSVDGKKWWLWVFATTVGDVPLVLRPSRGAGVVEEILGKEYRGTVVCDGWTAYLGYSLQRCWAHLLRVAKARAEEGPTARELYVTLRELYGRLTHGLEVASPRARAYRARVGERAFQGLLARFGASWGKGVRPVMTYLRNGRPWWLTFLQRRGVEPTNNRVERALREAVVIRKIVGTLRNARGAEVFARLLSVLGTWRAQEKNPATRLYTELS